MELVLLGASVIFPGCGWSWVPQGTKEVLITGPQACPNKKEPQITQICPASLKFFKITNGCKHSPCLRSWKEQFQERPPILGLCYQRSIANINSALTLATRIAAQAVVRTCSCKVGESSQASWSGNRGFFLTNSYFCTLHSLAAVLKNLVSILVENAAKTKR